MKHLRKINENQGEYLMVLHFESGDEIHISVLEMSHYTQIDSYLNSSPGYMNHDTATKLVEYIINNRVSDDLMCQSYVLEDYPFSKYNIVKAIHIPDMGC